jgi:hypothetical protein
MQPSRQFQFSLSSKVERRQTATDQHVKIKRPKGPVAVALMKRHASCLAGHREPMGKSALVNQLSNMAVEQKKLSSPLLMAARHSSVDFKMVGGDCTKDQSCWLGYRQAQMTAYSRPRHLSAFASAMRKIYYSKNAAEECIYQTVG